MSRRRTRQADAVMKQISHATYRYGMSICRYGSCGLEQRYSSTHNLNLTCDYLDIKAYSGLYSGCQKNVRYSNVFFYNHLCPNTEIRNIIMESGIKTCHSLGGCRKTQNRQLYQFRM